jgi:hypothetical protein
LSLEQQKGRQKEGATLATEWATWLASLLTQEKIHRGKDKAKSKETEVKCLIFQQLSSKGQASTSIQDLASLSTMMLTRCSAVASSRAQMIIAASATVGSRKGICFA